MLMQLKPGRHGSDSDVHSLMSAEAGVGEREPGMASSQAPAPPRATLGGVGPRLQTGPGQSCRARLSHLCAPLPKGHTSQNPGT